MTTTIIIALCTLMLIAYLFDLTSSKTRIPSVILLLLLGWVVRQITIFLGIHLPDFSSTLPELGTLGLILIVLEGSLELELNRSKIGLINKSLIGSILSMLVLSIIIALLFHYFGHYPLSYCLINAIPFCIISSAIAIPSTRNQVNSIREFTVYESSFSDILGVLFFTFITMNETYTLLSVGHFGQQILIMIGISFIATIGLSFLLSKIEHHIKFFPIIILVILIYYISKIYHLPALIFILLFGLFLGNIEKLDSFKWAHRIHLDILNQEVHRFKAYTYEASFIIRALFFLLFGYMIKTTEILNSGSIIWALGIVFIIFALRALQLKISGLSWKPLLFIAPRGLITILLFLSILPSQQIPLVNQSLITQVILITALIMMTGLMFTNNKVSGSGVDNTKRKDLSKTRDIDVMVENNNECIGDNEEALSGNQNNFQEYVQTNGTP